jgi:hypothetical protein
MAQIINDPAVKIVALPATRPPSLPSRIDTEMYRVLELPARMRLSDPERSTLVEIGKRLGRTALQQVAVSPSLIPS